MRRCRRPGRRDRSQRLVRRRVSSPTPITPGSAARRALRSAPPALRRRLRPWPRRGRRSRARAWCRAGEPCCGRRAGAAHQRLELGPAGQVANAAEVVARLRVGRHAHLREAPQHHQRIARAAAQALRARQQIHQLGIVRPALLRRPPRQIVERLELLRPAAATAASRHAAASAHAGGGDWRSRKEWRAATAASTRDSTSSSRGRRCGRCSELRPAGGTTSMTATFHALPRRCADRRRR